ncbi:MAG: transcriptional regulator, partial [Vallitaleaceae bacterium]|nr:transcriptional regulator [Vallitaleaceae bacterium]
KDELGTLADISNSIKDFHVNITHISVFNYKNEPKCEIIIRLNTLETEALVKHLEEKGYKILTIKKVASTI